MVVSPAQSDGLDLVLKSIPFDTLPPEEQKETMNEAQLMGQVDHPSFIRFYDAFLEDGCLNMVMEYCPGGDLQQKLQERERK